MLKCPTIKCDKALEMSMQWLAYIKTLIYETPIYSEEDFISKFTVTAASVRETP
ncbi:hypothetical protein AVEN_128326-1, partial [Araneus ventricosus]